MTPPRPAHALPRRRARLAGFGHRSAVVAIVLSVPALGTPRADAGDKEALQFTDRRPAAGDWSDSEQTSRNATTYTSALVNQGVVQRESKSERVESTLQRRIVTVKSVKDGRVLAWSVKIRDYETTSVLAGGQTKIRKHPLSGRELLCRRRLAESGEKSDGSQNDEDAPAIVIEPIDDRPLSAELEALLRGSQGFDPFEDPTERAFRDFLQRKPFRVGESRTFAGEHARRLLGFNQGPKDVRLTLTLRRIARLERAGAAGEFAAHVRAKGTVQPDDITLDVTLKGTWVILAGGTLPHSMVMTGKSTLTGRRALSEATFQRLTGEGRVKTSLSNDYKLSGELVRPPAPKREAPDPAAGSTPKSDKSSESDRSTESGKSPADRPDQPKPGPRSDSGD